MRQTLAQQPFRCDVHLGHDVDVGGLGGRHVRLRSAIRDELPGLGREPRSDVMEFERSGHDSSVA